MGCEKWPQHLSKNYVDTIRVANLGFKAKYKTEYLIYQEDWDAFFISKDKDPPPYIDEMKQIQSHSNGFHVSVKKLCVDGK